MLFAAAILQCVGRLGYDRHLFVLHTPSLDLTLLPRFYRSVFSAWQLLKISRNFNDFNCFWFLEEPLVFNPSLRIELLNSKSFISLLITAGLRKVRDFIDFNSFSWISADTLSTCLGFRSVRVLTSFLSDLRESLPLAAIERINQFFLEHCWPDSDTIFPSLLVSPSVTQDPDKPGHLLNLNSLSSLSLSTVDKKQLYEVCVKVQHYPQLQSLPDTPWRERLTVEESVRPAWRSLYKLPLPKRSGDLQWRILHATIATNAFLNILDPQVRDQCPFCTERETVFHYFLYCHRLQTLFAALKRIFCDFSLEFSHIVFIFGVQYSQKHKYRCQLANFLLGQAKLAILKSRKSQVEHGNAQSAVSVFKTLVMSRIKLDFCFYKMTKDLDKFILIWGVGGVLCDIENEELFLYL